MDWQVGNRAELIETGDSQLFEGKEVIIDSFPYYNKNMDAIVIDCTMIHRHLPITVGVEHLRIIPYDGNHKMQWIDCVWQPKKESNEG